jgi:hypothetical protein
MVGLMSKSVPFVNSDLNIDLLTNIELDLHRFRELIPPERMRRDAPKPPSGSVATRRSWRSSPWRSRSGYCWTPATASVSERARPHLVPVLLLVIATFVVYGRILEHDFLLSWDDFYYVTSNEAIKEISWKNIRTVFSSYYVGNYAPVRMLSYMLDHALWGLRAGGFLLVNLLLHALNGLLVYRLFYRFHANITVAACGAAIFLLHPLQVEQYFQQQGSK